MRNRYPDGGSHLLRETLAARTGLAAEEIFVGLGSSEIIDLASRVFLRPGLQGMTSQGSYAPFSVAIRASGAELVLVPQKNFAFDLEAMAKAITPKTGVIYLANPNNPTGTAFSFGGVGGISWARAGERAGGAGRGVRSLCAELESAEVGGDFSTGDANLLILRTFSKVYGLAGMRIGFAIGRPELHAAMNKLKTPFNTSGVAQAAALAAIDDREHVDAVHCDERERAEKIERRA